MDLLTVATHELRSPLTTIAGVATTLVTQHERMTTPEVHEALVILERQTKRLGLMLDQLLEFGTRDHTNSPRSVVSLADVVTDAIESAPPPAGVTVTVSGTPPNDAPCVVSSDRLAMTRVLINLLANTYNYGGPHVAVSWHNAASGVTLVVEDDGAGVPAWLVPDLFTPFVRGRNGSLPHLAGAGLGLALSRMLVESFDGYLTHEPVQPHGARFTVTLPAAMAGT